MKTSGHALVENRSGFFKTFNLIVFLMLSAAFAAPVGLKADTWLGSGEVSATQTRHWGTASNWAGDAVPGSNEIDNFKLTGDGTVILDGNRSVGGLQFADFTHTDFQPGAGGSLAFNNDAAGNPPQVNMGECLRDTYGVDYYTAGPAINASVILNADVDFNLGTAGRQNSAMLLSGTIVSTMALNNFDFYGRGRGASLWVTGTSQFVAPEFVNVNQVNPTEGNNGYALHLADAGRLNNATINLNSAASYLGLHDALAGGGAPVLQNAINSKGGNVFVDRSYQSTMFGDMNSTVNVLQPIVGTLTIVPPGTGPSVTNFGSTGCFGRTNNGYGIRIDQIAFSKKSTINVNNGNLTEERAGSRYISGANRLQEAHNYTYAGDLTFPPNLTLTKGGTGVLAVEQVNGAALWPTSPTVNAGVLRLGTLALPHTFAPGQAVNLSPNAGVGIAWDGLIDQTLAVPVPFRINPAAAGVGQSGALDIDLWDHGAAFPTFINPNVGAPAVNYLRVCSSKGGDASFDPQPNPGKHASTRAIIAPYDSPVNYRSRYYLGGGGGTLLINSEMNSSNLIATDLEMGTTGTLLPGRVALKPENIDGTCGANNYNGITDIRAGTLQLLWMDSVRGTSEVDLGTYDTSITNGLYANPAPGYSWTGPGQLLIDPGHNPQSPVPFPRYWSMDWYRTMAGGGNLAGSLDLRGGVIGWTGEVDLPAIPGDYTATVQSNLNPAAPNVYVLGLGGEYSSGSMNALDTFTIADVDDGSNTVPVLLYKAGKNSVLDLTSTISNTYTGGTIIAGGEIIINNAMQINAEYPSGCSILILNGGTLHVVGGAADTHLYVPIMVNTDGTPDTVKNCGSVLSVDIGTSATLHVPFDFRFAPGRYLEKTGGGQFNYLATAGESSDANAWGLKLTEGLTVVNQLPVNLNGNTGPIIFNNGKLQVTPMIPLVQDLDPGYGFRNLVSYKNTTSEVGVEAGALFAINGLARNEIMGSLYIHNIPTSAATSVVHLSRSMASAGSGSPMSDSCGSGTMRFEGVTVYMTGGPAASRDLNVLPKDAGFSLELHGGTVFYASKQNNVNGAVLFLGDPTKTVQIDGEEASAAPVGRPYSFTLTPQTWTIGGTGPTVWNETVEKVGLGTVSFKRMAGAAVTVGSTALLKISGGTLVADGTADPFTDSATNVSLDVVNDSTAFGFVILAGEKTVHNLTGVGDTYVVDGATLNATSIVQNSLTVGGSAPPYSASAVPEPSSFALLGIALASAGWFACRGRKKRRRADYERLPAN